MGIKMSLRGPEERVARFPFSRVRVRKRCAIPPRWKFRHEVQGGLRTRSDSPANSPKPTTFGQPNPCAAERCNVMQPLPSTEPGHALHETDWGLEYAGNSHRWRRAVPVSCEWVYLFSGAQ